MIIATEPRHFSRKGLILHQYFRLFVMLQLFRKSFDLVFTIYKKHLAKKILQEKLG